MKLVVSRNETICQVAYIELLGYLHTLFSAYVTNMSLLCHFHVVNRHTSYDIIILFKDSYTNKYVVCH